LTGKLNLQAGSVYDILHANHKPQTTEADLNRITNLRVRKIFDGTGRATIELEVETTGGRAVASPSFAHARTRGKYEVVHYPEGGVDEAIETIRSPIRDKLIGMDVTDQEAIDATLRRIDGTENFARIGGNTAEVVSMTVAKAAAASLGIPLHLYLGGTFARRFPNFLINIVGGGPTAGGEIWRGRGPDIQEHNLIPIGFDSVFEASEAAIEVHGIVGEMLHDLDPTYTGGRDYEYSWVPALPDVPCFQAVADACRQVSKGRRGRFRLGVDFAASDLWKPDQNAYVYAREGVVRTRAEHAKFVRELIERFELFYVEDPFHEDDLAAYVDLCRDVGNSCLVVGDDLYATDPKRLQAGIAAGAANAVVVKLNMIATVTDTQHFVDLAKTHQIATCASPRTCDTTDDTLAHLAIGWGTTMMKTGGAVGGERLAKVNEMIRIEERLGGPARFAKFPTVQP